MNMDSIKKTGPNIQLSHEKFTKMAYQSTFVTIMRESPKYDILF